MPHFTKDVSSLLSKGEANDISKENTKEKFSNSEQVDKLKKQFAVNNKVGTVESNDKSKATDSMLETHNNSLQIPTIKKPEFKKKTEVTLNKYDNLVSGLPASTIKEIIDEDQNVGDADAEQALDLLARFNEDMSMLALNVYQIYNLFDMVGKENEEIIEWMHTLERQTVNVEDKHLKIEKKIDQLLGSLK